MKTIKSFTLSHESIRYLAERSAMTGQSRSTILDGIINEYAQQAYKAFVADVRRQIDEICPDREVATNGQE
ncbi:MAG: hypothetical protein CVU60_13540 [Deltaproteobacteria bacterium HGW-Deltaproteobacteria-18]|jgi:hypothetical protein|nr:MAG: hypothetical protein CVU60_13540 [Deltaproteobacteria bacterium HGW-Deltaproteobacteria-18]